MALFGDSVSRMVGGSAAGPQKKKFAYTEELDMPRGSASAGCIIEAKFTIKKVRFWI
jgi:hypothetical protein